MSGRRNPRLAARSGWAKSLTRKLLALGGWDWLTGGIVATSLLLGVILIGDGLYIKAKAALAQILLNRAWAATMDSSAPTRPWPWMDTWPVAHIEFPRLNRSTIALAGASGQALAFGPVHLSQSPMPGTRGTSVFAAHRDTQFAFMDQLKTGDRINMTDSAGNVSIYEIQSFRIARWDNSGLDPDANDFRLALVTCWPLDAMVPGPMRYIAEAKMIRSDPVAGR